MMQTKTNLKKSWPVEHQDISSNMKVEHLLLFILLTCSFFFFIVAIIMTVLIIIIIIYK